MNKNWCLISHHHLHLLVIVGRFERDMGVTNEGDNWHAKRHCAMMRMRNSPHFGLPVARKVI